MLALLGNTRLCIECLPGSNTLAYFAGNSRVNKKVSDVTGMIALSMYGTARFLKFSLIAEHTSLLRYRSNNNCKKRNN